MGDKSRLRLGVYQNPRGDRSKESIRRYTDGFRKKNTRTTITDRGTVRKINLLTGGQAKIAAKAPPPNVINEKDFKVLRAEKAKGRGMGLQDESVQPGKVMKANKGKSAMVPLKKGYSKTLGVFPTINKVKPSVGGSGMGKGTDKVSTKKAEDFMKRRKELGGAGKALKATKIGKMLLPVAAAGVAAQQYLKSKMKKKDEPKKKMGGGMMQKPIGYKSGMGPAGAAGSMAGRPGGRRQMQQGPKGGIGSLPKKRSDDLVILVNSGDGKIRKIKRSEFEDNMSAPKQKMGGGMMKARRGRIVDDQKRDKRNPNRKPSTKIFDKIGDILKTPYYIRGGKKEKKMGGGMIAPSQRPGYSKGTMVKARGCKLGRTRPTKIT